MPTEREFVDAAARRKVERDDLDKRVVIIEACTCAWPVRRIRNRSGHPRECASSALYEMLFPDKARRTNHNHPTRDIRPIGTCPGCDEYHARQGRCVPCRGTGETTVVWGEDEITTSKCGACGGRGSTV